LLEQFVKLLPAPKKLNRKRGRKKNRTNANTASQPDPNRVRASQYARNQDLWYKNKRRLWDLIKFGDIRPRTEGKESEFFEFFTNLFTRDSRCRLEEEELPPRRLISLTQYISKEEIERFVLIKQ